MTLCGLANPIEIDVVAGFRFLCRTCFPPQRETAWTSDNENTGDTISGDGRGEQPDEPPET